MTANLILGAVVFALSFAVAMFRNIGTAFAFCFLPALIFTRAVTGYMLNGGLPELRISNAAMAGLMLAMVFKIGQLSKIRWSWVDLIVVLATVCAISSAVQSETWHTGYNELLKQLFAWLVPYFVARFCFRDEAFRRNCLNVLIVSAIILGLFAAIEFRMWPHFFSETLRKTGLHVVFNPQAVQRGSFFRAEVSFAHPIFFGDGCVSIFCLVLMLASTLKGGWMRPMVLLAAAAVAGGLFTSISFGPYLAMCIAGGIFVLLRFVSLSRAYVIFVGVGVAIVFMAMLSVYAAGTEIPPRPKDGSLKDSFFVRWEIVQKCWPLAVEAGPFGWGKPKLDEVDIKGHRLLDLESVDNAYMLFLIVRGYVYAALWALIPLILSLRVCMALNRNKRKEFIFPIAIGAGSSIGISFAFYFVWAGWNPEPYTILWLIATAFTMSACDVCFDGIKADAGRPAGNPQAVGAMQATPARPYPYQNVARA